MLTCACGYQTHSVADMVDHILFMVTTGQEGFEDHHETHN